MIIQQLQPNPHQHYTKIPTKPKPTHEIENILEADKSDYKIRKTLYITSEMVIDLEIGKTLTRIKENIFRYEDCVFEDVGRMGYIALIG